jgi:hypothetical protein
MSRQSTKLGCVLVSVLTLLTVIACRRPTQAPATSTSTPAATISDIHVEPAEAERTSGRSEEFPLPNCGGTGNLKQSLTRQFEVRRSSTIENRASTTGGVEVEIPTAVKATLEAQLEQAYQQTYQSVSSSLYGIEMLAAPGTHVVYVIQWEEQKFVADVSYTMEGEIYRAPYTYKLTSPKISGSYQVKCPTSPTVQPTDTSLPPPPTPTTPPPTETQLPPTLTPLPPTPAIVPEDCLPYNPADLQIMDEGVDGWLLTDNVSRMLMLDNEADATDALALAKRHTAHCFIGRDNTRSNRRDYIVEYWIGDSGRVTTIVQRDCIPYNRANLQIIDEGTDGWLLTDGASRMLMLNNERDAQKALIMANRYAYQCFIGRGNFRPDRRLYIVEYWE